MKFIALLALLSALFIVIDEVVKPMLPTTYQPGQSCALGSMYVIILMTSRSLTGNELYKVYDGTHTMWTTKTSLKECK